MVGREIMVFYGEYGLFFFAFLLIAYSADTYTSKNEIIKTHDAEEEEVQNKSVYPKWKIVLVMLIGYDCFFKLRWRHDNTTFLILLVYTSYVLRRLLIAWKYKKAGNL